jgi:hypothetical protein
MKILDLKAEQAEALVMQRSAESAAVIGVLI